MALIEPIRIMTKQRQALATNGNGAATSCPLAKQLADYAATITGPLLEQKYPSQERLYQGMVKLTLRYFRLYEQAPKAHRKHRSGQGHRCLHQEWEAAFRTLAAMLEATAEPRLFRQPKAAPAPPPAPVVEAPRRKTVAEAMMEAMGS